MPRPNKVRQGIEFEKNNLSDKCQVCDAILGFPTRKPRLEASCTSTKCVCSVDPYDCKWWNANQSSLDLALTLDLLENANISLNKMMLQLYDKPENLIENKKLKDAIDLINEEISVLTKQRDIQNEKSNIAWKTYMNL